MVDKYGTGQDPYCYSDTKILRNLFNIRDENILQEAEREITTVASRSIRFSLPPYNLTYFKNIHFALFSRIYDWAGQLRTIDISKNETHLCVVSRIEPEANKLFQALKTQNYFTGLPNEKFIECIAEFYGDINMLHPFREGNGRTQRIFFDHLALNAGYTIDWSVAAIKRWKEANINAVECNYDILKNILTQGLKNIDR